MRCDQKRKYLTRIDAKRSAKSWLLNGGEHMYSYKCECTFFHLTKKRERPFTTITQED